MSEPVSRLKALFTFLDDQVDHGWRILGSIGSTEILVPLSLCLWCVPCSVKCLLLVVPSGQTVFQWSEVSGEDANIADRGFLRSLEFNSVACMRVEHHVVLLDSISN